MSVFLAYVFLLFSQRGEICHQLITDITFVPAVQLWSSLHRLDLVTSHMAHITCLWPIWLHFLRTEFCIFRITFNKLCWTNVVKPCFDRLDFSQLFKNAH